MQLFQWAWHFHRGGGMAVQEEKAQDVGVALATRFNLHNPQKKKNKREKRPDGKSKEGKAERKNLISRRTREALKGNSLFYFFLIRRQQSVKNRSHFWYKTVRTINQIPTHTLGRKQAQEVALAEKSML